MPCGTLFQEMTKGRHSRSQLDTILPNYLTVLATCISVRAPGERVAITRNILHVLCDV